MSALGRERFAWTEAETTTLVTLLAEGITENVALVHCLRREHPDRTPAFRVDAVIEHRHNLRNPAVPRQGHLYKDTPKPHWSKEMSCTLFLLQVNWRPRAPHKMSDLGDCMDKIFPIATFTDYVIRLHLRRAERKQPEVRIWSEAEKFDLQMLNNGDYDYAQVTACLTQRHQKIFTEPYTRAMLHLTELEIVPVITTVKESIYLASFYWNVGGSHGSLAEYMTEALQLRPAYTETTVASLLGVMKLEADPLRELSAATLRWEAAQVERLRQWAARHAGPEHIASELFGNTDRLTVYKVQAMLSAVDRGVQPVHWTDEQPQLLVKLTRDEFPVERLVEKMDETYGRVFSIPMLIKEYARLQAAGVNIQSSPHLEALMYVE